MTDRFVPKYFPPSLNGHKVLYKGKRYWVFEVTTKLPFGWVDCDDWDYVIFDKSNELFTKVDTITGKKDYNEGIVAVGTKNQDGSFKAETWFGQHAIEFEGETVRDLVSSYIVTEKELRKYC